MDLESSGLDHGLGADWKDRQREMAKLLKRFFRLSLPSPLPDCGVDSTHVNDRDREVKPASLGFFQDRPHP